MDVALGRARLAHLGDGRELGRAVGPGAVHARHLLGILAQRVEEARQESLLALDEAPVHAPVVDEPIEVRLAKLRPLLANLGDGPLTRHAKVERRPQQAGTLGTQARGELGAGSGVKLGLDEAHGTAKLAGVLEPRDVGRQPVVEMEEVIVRCLIARHALIGLSTRGRKPGRASHALSSP